MPTAGVADSAEGPSASAAATADAPFYIPAVAPPSRPRRTLKHDDTFAVFDSHGDIGAAPGGPDGLFDRDTRHLSHLELLVEGAQPLLLGSAVRDDNLNYHVDLTNPDIFADGRLRLRKDAVHIARTIYLSDGSLRERIAAVNYGSDTIELTLSLAFASDFADIFEVRGARRARRGRMWREIVGSDGVLLGYRGLDETRRETALWFDPAPTRLLDSAATYTLELAPGARYTLFLTAASRGPLPKSRRTFLNGLLQRRREVRRQAHSAAAVETSNRLLNEVLCRSAADLDMLITGTPEGPYPYAGIPWYSTTFGRDGIITALEMLWARPALAEGVLRRLARYQAQAFDAAADASPGKILHEMRAGEMAVLGEVPFGLYYGSVDATPLFVVLAGAYARRTGNDGVVRELWPAVERALAWLDAADGDGDGFVEYARATPAGLVNQGWKDSQDSVFHADGRLAEGPIALVEVQAYAHAARLAAAECARRLGLAERAAELEALAERLRCRFEDAFWCEDLGSYALALDGRKQPCKVLTSNAGHALLTGIASPERGRRVARGLLRRSFYSGWGIRTVAEGQARYNPMSYHNGSIWPHDNALIAQGLARYGMKGAVAKLFDDLVQAAGYMEHRRIPELYCGFRRRHGRGPTLYPTACAPQAWAAAAPFSMLEAMLGLEFDHAGRRIRLHDPVLPAAAGGALLVRNLSLGTARVDFALHRGASGVSLQVLRSVGDIEVSLVARSATAASPRG